MKIRFCIDLITALIVILNFQLLVSAADPWADAVVSYTPGNASDIGNPDPYQTDGTQSLGPPSRDTGFGSQVGVFYPAFTPSELVAVGGGGELVVRFDEPVENDPLNPFGIDLLVFGNAFFTVGTQGRKSVANAAFIEPGDISVSQDNINWHDILDVYADDLFPTLGYSDTVYTGAGNSGGTIPTDFTKPVDPSFDPFGETESEINTAYDGSGGGTGVDLSDVELDWIQYVRVSVTSGSSEIDAFADVSAVLGQPPILTADFDDNTVVNGKDFLIWQRGYGIESGAEHADGDATGDGVVNGDDLHRWSEQFTGVASSSSATSATESVIPEPSSCTLATVTLFVLLLSLKGRMV